MSCKRLTQRAFNTNTKPRPQCASSQLLANDFVNFFTDKISKIRSNLESWIDSILHNPNPTTQPVIPVLDFDIASDNEIHQIICSSANKSCSLDLIPTWFLKSTIDSFLPIITHIVNTSISTGIFPDSLKHAIVTPILKKPSADINELANYRPVSNLPFLSKVIEKVIVSRITAHMDDHNLWESHQSAYRSGHSTETALLSIKNDIMLAIGDKKGVFLVLLDLSAAFDTVDHQILLRTISESIGLTGKALSWFRSYLNNRSCSVCIDGEFSHTQSLEYGVPQGSTGIYNLYKADWWDNSQTWYSFPYICWRYSNLLYLQPQGSGIDTISTQQTILLSLWK